MNDPVSIARRAGLEARAAGVLVRSGMLAPDLPHRTARVVRAISRYGAFGGLLSAAAARHGDRPGVIDERGTLSWNELDRRTNAIANALAARGIRTGDGVAILARNHRGFLDAAFGAAKTGARLILLNTDFAGPQIREVAEREGTRILICDAEYLELLDGVEGTPIIDEHELDRLATTGDPTVPPKPDEHSKVIILTSGTTGTPKGASRAEPRSLIQVGALLHKVPFRTRRAHAIGAPLFHALGFATMALSIGMGCTMLLRRRFTAEGFADDLARADAAVVVPVMMRRVLALDDLDRRDFSRLQILFCGGSQLGAELCRELTAAFGPVVYNLYGSTEVAYATIATPEELAIEPGSVGSPPPGAVVRILDERGNELPAGQTGRIFVNNGFAFEGYTGGGSKEVIDGLMSSGDVGHFDAAGRLFIDGRDDEMIVSGGENVFPREIEELLARHDAIK
ncbi:MAG: fatty-acyl-CoA synthase, partial [Solirubrobacteraceae bacterium]|nr:fatty-acyl-CoA synthase [Solirubrobacteraceae bacterium]